MGHFDDDKCFECGATEDIQHHHVVPRARQGTKTIPLCYGCHRKSHHQKDLPGGVNHSRLVREALQRARDRGVKLGNPDWGKSVNEARQEGKRNAAIFNFKIQNVVVNLDQNQYPTLKSKVDFLNENEIYTRRGCLWSIPGLHRTLNYKIDKTLDEE